MKNIFENIVDFLSVHKVGMLATIVWTSGSTPAPPQSKILISLDGERIAGTIGGGCVEDSIIRRAVALENKNSTVIIEFELNDEEAESGLICGGSLKVLLEPINQSQIEVFRILSERLEQGIESILVTQVLTDGSTQKSVLDEQMNFLVGASFDMKLISKSPLTKLSPVIENYGDVMYVAEPIEAKVLLYIFGGGHVGKAVSKFAAQCGFNVTIVDDRIEYTNREKFPEVDETICLPFRNISEHLSIGESAFVIIVTRGHSYDELVLEQVLKFKPKYIGMIGSKRKVLVAYKNLIAKGVKEKELKQVFAPVGLDIGAVSVEEIAVSIVAEMIKVRRKYGNALVKHKRVTN